MPAVKKRLQTSYEWVKSPSHSLVSAREFAIYNMGKEKGAEEFAQKHEDNIAKNFEKSYIDTSKVLEKLSEKNIEVISARLKIESVYSLKILVSIKDVEGQPDRLESIYDFIFDLESSNNNDDYIVNFSIIKANNKFLDSRVESDGYIYKHRLLTHEESARTA